MNNRDPSGRTNLSDVGGGLSAHAGMSAQAVNMGGRYVFKKIGCELLAAAGEEAIKYGIYILSDGAGAFYVGHSNQIDRRLQEHAKDAAKNGMKMVASFFVDKQGGKDLLRIAEQHIFDAMEEEVGRDALKNKVNPLDKKRGRLKDAFKKYPMCK